MASIPQGRLAVGTIHGSHFHGKKRSSSLRCVWGEVAGTLGRGDKTTMKEVPESQGQQVVVQTLQYYVPLFCMIWGILRSLPFIFVPDEICSKGA